MKATARLDVVRDMRMTVTMELTVEEADALLEATKDVHRWPMSRFKECFRQALHAARNAYSSEHITE